MFGTKVNHWNNTLKQSKAKPQKELPVAVATKIVQSSPKKEMRDDVSKSTDQNSNEITFRIIQPTALLFPPRAEMNNSNNSDVPLFEQVGVPYEIYMQIYNMIENEMLPIALEVHKINGVYKSNEVQNKTNTHYDKYDSGGDIHRGRRLDIMSECSAQMSIMQRNLDLVAARLVHKVNAMLFKYGLGCTYTFHRTRLERYSTKQTKGNEQLEINGLEFFSIDK